MVPYIKKDRGYLERKIPDLNKIGSIRIPKLNASVEYVK